MQTPATRWPSSVASCWTLLRTSPRVSSCAPWARWWPTSTWVPKASGSSRAGARTAWLAPDFARNTTTAPRTSPALCGNGSRGGAHWEKPAELLAHHVVDPAESIDGHLSTAALEFARLLIDGKLSMNAAGGWIEANVCDPAFETTAGFTPFDVFSKRSAAAEALHARFSDREWQALSQLPEQVAVAAALSGATGGFDDARAVIAGIRSIDAAAKNPSELVRAVVAERFDEGYDWGNDDRSPEDRIERTLSAVHEQIVRLRALGLSSSEIDAYASFLLTVANAAVRGSRSGGVLGIGGHAVSRQEAGFLDRLEATLEASLPGCDGCLG